MTKRAYLKNLIFVLCAVFVLSLSLFFVMSNRKVKGLEAVLDKDISLEIEYGKEYLIENSSITYGQDSKEASVYVLTPTGKKIEDDSILIDSYGKYSLVYYADFGGETVTVSKELICKMPLFNISSENDTLSYLDGVNNSICYEVEGKKDYTDVIEINNPDNKKYSVVDKQITGAYLNLSEGTKATSNEVLDFNLLSKDNPFIEFYMLPNNPGVSTKPITSNSDYVLGSRDFGRMTMTLTDVYDENNYINIVVLDADSWFCYVMTSTRSNQLSGWSYETDANGNPYSRIISNGRFGTGIRLSMTNVHYSTDRFGQDWSKCWCRLYLNYEEKALYVEVFEGKYKVLDFDDSTNVSELWEGFSKGKAKLTLSCTQFAGSDKANIIVSKFNGKDVTSREISDNDLPNVNIDFNKYSSDNIPNALVNANYPIFNSIMQDGNGLGLISKVTVTHNEENVEVKDGSFCPKESGEYLINYIATDLYGNETKISYTVMAFDKLDEIKIGLKDELKFEINQGEFIVLPSFTTFGGSGLKSVENYALIEGDSKVLTFENGKLLAEKPGKYLVEYLLTDYIGQKYLYHYIVNVLPSNKPVFVSDVNLPKYLVYGKKYALPTLKGRVYKENGEYEEINSKISVTDGLGERVLSDNIFEVKADNNYIEKLTIKYSLSLNGKDTVKEYYVTAVNIGDNENIDFSKYFDYLSNSSGENTESSLRLSFENGKGEARFIREILTDGAEIKFSLPTQKDIDRLNIYLENFENGKRIKMSYFTNKNGNATFSVNDGVIYTLSKSFEGENTITLIVNDLNKTISPSSGTVVPFTKYEDGDMFDGFDSRSCYISFELIGSFNKAYLDIQKINIQNLKDDVSSDRIGPAMSLIDIRKVRYLPGDTVIINKAVSYDVLDTYSYVIVSAYRNVTIDGKKVKEYCVSKDGIELKNVLADRVFEIENLETGKYSLSYVAYDSSNKSTSSSLSFEIQDIEAPKITLNDNMNNFFKLGDTINLAQASVIDNVEVVLNPEEDGKEYYIYAYTPNGKYELVKDFKYVLSSTGEYKFIYMAFDNAGNMGKYTHIVYVGN